MPVKNFFSDTITNLPQANITGERVNSHLFQGENQQLIFLV
jgi:hypothetical protein